MLPRLLLNKYILLCIVLIPAIEVSAQSYRMHPKGPVHSINLSLGGGASMSNSHWQQEAPVLKDKMGGDVEFALTYEVSEDWFVFGLGIGLGYNYTRQRIDSFAHLFERLDRENDEITYAYRYTDYNDEQQRVMLSVPLYMGANIGRYCYLLVGAKATFPLQAKHRTQTILSTDGTYNRFIHTIENAPTYGYYPAAEYAYEEGYQEAQWYLAPLLEVGSNFQVNRGVGMRVGLYAEYDFPFRAYTGKALVDYSRVDDNPHRLSQDNLKENILFNAPSTTTYCQKATEYWTIGLKWTCQFMFSRRHNVCRCLEM